MKTEMVIIGTILNLEAEVTYNTPVGDCKLWKTKHCMFVNLFKNVSMYCRTNT